jgi:hypothetical protein
MGIELSQKEKEELLNAVLFFLAKDNTIIEELHDIMNNTVSKIEDYEPLNN